MEAIALEPKPKVSPPLELRKSLYRPELDAVRFVAFILVFAHHNLSNDVAKYPHNFKGTLWLMVARVTGFGLPLFFFLSAYLISDLLIREKKQVGRIDVAAFYKRRILRIWPLYVLGLAIGWLISVHSGHPQTARFLSFFLILGNWSVVKFGWFDNPMVILWSISVEEQFYLFWPTVARKVSEKGMYIVCGILLLIANLFLVYFALVGSDLDGVVWCNTFVQFELFAGGILLAIKLRQSLPDFSNPHRLLLLAAAALSWMVSALVFKPIMGAHAVSPIHLVLGYALITVGCALLLLGVLGVKPGTVPKWLAYLGRISFGLYVYHEIAGGIAVAVLPQTSTLDQLASKVASLLITIALAALSYRFFETPFLRLKAKLEVIRSRPV